MSDDDDTELLLGRSLAPTLRGLGSRLELPLVGLVMYEVYHPALRMVVPCRSSAFLWPDGNVTTLWFVG